MSLIDPNVDAQVMAALAQSQQPRLQVAQPLNDVQLVILAAAKLAPWVATLPAPVNVAADAVSFARAIFVEAVVQQHEAPIGAAIERRLTELHPSEKTPAGQQYIIPGSK